MKRYFVHSHLCTEFFDTADMARQAAVEYIEEIRDDSGDEWIEEVESVVWGEVREKAQPVPVGEHGEFVEYVLKPLDTGKEIE